MTKNNTSVLALAFWAALGAGACGSDEEGESAAKPSAVTQSPAYIASTRKFSPYG